MDTTHIYKVKNWGLQKRKIKESSIRYVAPELFECYQLVGDIVLHPHFQEGKQIVTSIITSKCKRIITTISGSKYELVGEPILAFKDSYIKAFGTFDKEDPLCNMIDSQ